MIWKWWFIGLWFLIPVILLAYLLTKEDAWNILAVVGIAIFGTFGIFFTGGAILYHTNYRVKNWLNRV